MIPRSMSATVAATPLCWTLRPWKRSAAGTIPAAAFSIRCSLDRGGAGVAGCRFGGGAGLCRAGLPAGGDPENQPLAHSARRDRQLSVVAALGGCGRYSPVAAAWDGAF